MAEQTVMVPAPTMAQMLRQAGVLFGIAASVALGVWIVLWGRSPDYSLLYASLSDRDTAEVAEALTAAGIPYRIDHASGGIMIAADKVHDARLKLAAAGLPKTANLGFELLAEASGFGTSKFIENVRYQRALEGELARTIGHLANVRGVRVHLAIPADSVFARDRRRPSASVLLDLHAGRSLSEGQIGAIVHLVSASVPDLQPQAVTVVDQHGRLLTSRYGDDELGLSARRFEYTKRVERSYAERIEAILAPIVGHDGVQAQVTAEIDFTAVEQTSESFNPDMPAVRSEQTVEQRRHADAAPGGVPGALSNEPPGAAEAPEVAAAAPEEGNRTAPEPAQVRREEVRNYELDKTISHMRLPAGSVRRLSAAVVINHKPVVGADGSVQYQALEEAELERITALVKEAIGFDASRGDSVNVINAQFTVPPPAAPVPEPPLWERPWVWGLGKQALAGLVALLVAFGVIRPAVSGLMRREGAAATTLPGAEAVAALPAGGVSHGHDSSRPQLAPAAAGGDLEVLRTYVAQEPKLAAQVVKSWVADD